MKDDRKNLFSQILRRNKKDEMLVVGEGVDRTTKEVNAMFPGQLDPNSPEAAELRKNGFTLIYPAPLKENKTGKMDVVARNEYNAKLNSPMVIDNTDLKTTDLASKIISQYLSAGSPMLTGQDFTGNTITPYPDWSEFEANAMSQLQTTLDNLGYETSIAENNLSVKSDIPFPTVQKSNLSKIFDRAKSKIKDAFNKIKGALTKEKDSKTNEDKNNDAPEL